MAAKEISIDEIKYKDFNSYPGVKRLSCEDYYDEHRPLELCGYFPDLEYIDCKNVILTGTFIAPKLQQIRSSNNIYLHGAVCPELNMIRANEKIVVINGYYPSLMELRGARQINVGDCFLGRVSIEGNDVTIQNVCGKESSINDWGIESIKAWCIGIYNREGNLNVIDKYREIKHYTYKELKAMMQREKSIAMPQNRNTLVQSALNYLDPISKKGRALIGDVSESGDFKYVVTVDGETMERKGRLKGDTVLLYPSNSDKPTVSIDTKTGHIERMSVSESETQSFGRGR